MSTSEPVYTKEFDDKVRKILHHTITENKIISWGHRTGKSSVLNRMKDLLKEYVEDAKPPIEYQFNLNGAAPNKLSAAISKIIKDINNEQ